MKRRRLVGGAGIGLAAAGLASGIWWRQNRQPAQPSELWSLEFERPGGGMLRMSALRGRPLLLNFWATWCPPCVTEMPLLDSFQQQRRAHGWQVVGLAVDQIAPVRDYLKRRPVSFDIGMAGLAGIELSRRLGNLNGALPFSVVCNASGGIADRRLGAVDQSSLDAWHSQVR